jgi:eukaryotic-like serine/threonine-protein kinase
MKLCPKCHKQFSDDANFCPVDAARLAPLESQSVAADTISAKFDVGDRLGGVRTGAVHRATDKATGHVAALKVIAPAVVALPGLAQRLERELKQLERVHSAGVAKVLASGKRGDDTWVALELLDGAQTLAEAIAARGPIPLEQAAHLIEVVGEALIEAAQVGVVHRDLAPKNVLFAGDEIKLINFSLPVPPVPGDGVPGVAEFVAPEQHDGKPVDQRSNLYSLGALYYFVLTGQAVQHDDGAVRLPSALAPVPAAVEAVIVRALDKSPTKRFLTVRQFVDEVGRVARGEVDAVKAMGRAKPKAELVQTLLGVRGGFGGAVVAPAPSAPSAAAIVASTLSIQPSVPTTVPGVVVGPTASGAVTAQMASGAVTEPTAGAVSGLPHGQPTLLGPAMPAPLQPQALAPERSPWAPPSNLGPQGEAAMAPEGRSEAPVEAPMVAAPVVAAPIVAAPVVAAPVVAAPIVPAPVVPAPVLPAPIVPAPLLAKPILGGVPSGGGKKSNKADKPDPRSKGKFRETMWFKKGELDVQAAEAAAAEHAKTGKDGNDKADQMPIDERYKDDGTLSRSDKEKYSLRTGATMMTAAFRDSGAHNHLGKVSEDALIDEMKGGRNKIFALIAVALVVIVVIIVMLAR